MKTSAFTKKKTPSRLRITLGRSWQQFVPNPEPGTELLGTLSRGAQVGALARLADGRYVQINGDWVTPLNSARIEHALRSARLLPGASAARSVGRPMESTPEEAGPAAAPAAAPVTVHVRKRRAAQLPGAGSEPTAAPPQDAIHQDPAAKERRVLSMRRGPSA
jgi:hypothetical protein